MNMKLPTLVIALALPALSYSQERRQVPDSRNTKNRSTETQHLEKNISISVSGKIVDGTPINSTITGCGRVFRAETILGEKTISGSNIPIIGTLEFNISPDGEEGYIIAYKIGVQIPLPTSSVASKNGGSTATNIQFRDIVLTNVARCALNKKLVIYGSGDQALSLSVTEP